MVHLSCVAPVLSYGAPVLSCGAPGLLSGDPVRLMGCYLLDSKYKLTSQPLWSQFYCVTLTLGLGLEQDHGIQWDWDTVSQPHKNCECVSDLGN